MSKYRMYYRQDDGVKYISHLDFLRTVNRIFKRAGIPIKFSNGFNPHTIMTIGLPLSVGTTSTCDVLDVELVKDVETSELLNTLNNNVPYGISFTKIVKNDGLKPLFNIDSAVYTASFTTDKSINFEDYLNAKEVLIEKKSKRGIGEVNIKDFIRSIDVFETNGTSHILKMHINAGNFSNLKPELVLKSLEKFYNTVISDVFINRDKIYFDDGIEV